MPCAGTVALEPRTIGPAVGHPGVVRSTRRVADPGSEFAGFRFPPEVITLAVRWYLRFGLSYRDVEELLAERGIEVDHTTLFRWVVRFTPLFVEAARPSRHTPGDHWFIDETSVKVDGRWRYLCRAVDQFGQVVDVLVSPNRDQRAARRFFPRALAGATAPVEVTTDRAAADPRVLDEFLPAAQHVTCRFANNRVEVDHGRLKARLRPMRGLKRDRSLRVVATGHAFVQNLRRPLRTGDRGRGPGSRGGRVRRTRPRRLIDPARQPLSPAPLPHNATVSWQLPARRTALRPDSPHPRDQQSPVDHPWGRRNRP